MGRKVRAKLTEAQFQRLIDATDKLASDDQELVGLAEHVRGNLKLSLEERRTIQQIKESKRRMQTDEELLALIHKEILPVAVAERERERVRVILIDDLRFPFADQLVELLYPSETPKRYVMDVLAAYKARFPSE